jgi:DNA-directed RNA polymerase beta subunit
MPFTDSGIIPDMVMNPHSFPTRMTVGQIYETQLAKNCAMEGTMADGTIFRNYEIDDIIAKSKELGLEYYGRERLYTGMNGVWMDSLIFLGPVYYQRLQKFVSKSIYSIDIGPTDIITHQPLDGKANQGGLRISELQRDVLFAQGVARFFSEKFFIDSDDFEINICRCGAMAIVNQHSGIYNCLECGDDADIYTIHSSWSAKQFIKELNAMHIGTKFTLDPFTFYS